MARSWLAALVALILAVFASAEPVRTLPDWEPRLHATGGGGGAVEPRAASAAR